jgi:hypothetical protein
LSRQSTKAIFTVIRDQDLNVIEERVNKLLLAGSKILDFKIGIDPAVAGYNGQVVVAILHCPCYYPPVDVFGSPDEDEKESQPKDAQNPSDLNAQGINEVDLPDGDEDDEEEELDSDDID